MCLCLFTIYVTMSLKHSGHIIKQEFDFFMFRKIERFNNKLDKIKNQ